MKNLAGVVECDKTIEVELRKAGIPMLKHPVFAKGEVPSSILGILDGWTFKRAWYYWVAKADAGVALPFSLADPLHEEYGKDVRVAGNCTCPSPQEWYGRPYYLGVPMYHVDTQEGLGVLAGEIQRSRYAGGRFESSPCAHCDEDADGCMNCSRADEMEKGDSHATP